MPTHDHAVDHQPPEQGPRSFVEIEVFMIVSCPKVFQFGPSIEVFSVTWVI